MYFKFNSWDEFYKKPFGAVPIGEKVTFRIKTNNIVNIKLHTSFRGTEQFYPMIPWKEDPEVYEVTIDMPSVPGLLFYDFQFDAFGSHYIYGTTPDGIGGEGQVNLFNQNAYQITVYDPKRKVPDWFKTGIIYQIFPDRFYKGEFEGYEPEYHAHAVLHTRWEDSPHYFRAPNGAITYWDFFGGNLAGIIEKLDYLKKLGISIIYLNPIFEAASNHKYDTADYLKIAPEFGNKEIFKTLCKEAEKRGIHIILDGVFNHTGDNSRYFNRYGIYDDLGAYQSKNSPYYNWYQFKDYPNDYESWWGIRSMPSMNKENQDYQSFIYSGDQSVVRKWLRDGASGWRLDVADELTDEFIGGIKEAMLMENEDSVLIGEVWEDASNKVAYGKLRDYFLGRELDSVMNYPFRNAVLGFMIGQKTSTQALRELMSLYEHYPKENFMACMNLIDSHDRIRALSALGINQMDANYMSEEEKEAFKLDSQQLRDAVNKLELISLVQMTFPGVPTIYYGDEAGMQGLDDPYNRGAYIWGHEDEKLKRWYHKIICLRNSSDTLKYGDFKPIFTQDDVFAFNRSYQDETIITIINRNLYQGYTVEVGEDTARNLFNGEIEDLKKVEIDPGGYKVLTTKFDSNLENL